jgi:hypothetical protein
VIADEELLARVEQVADPPREATPPVEHPAAATSPAAATPAAGDALAPGTPSDATAPGRELPPAPPSFPPPPWQSELSDAPAIANGPPARSAQPPQRRTQSRPAPEPAPPTPPLSANGFSGPAAAPLPALQPTEGVVAPLETPAHQAQAARRRRRSATLLPPLPSPADIPEDAAGRVEIFAIATLPDVTSPNSVLTPPAPSPSGETAPITGMAGATGPLAGWMPVLLLGVVLVVVFVVGVLVTR